MRNLKRALSLALSTVMLMGTMVVGSSASYVDVASEHNTEAIEVLQAVGIMTGDEKGNFNPDANVTRNEMAVIMCNLMDYVVSSYKGTAPFTDVPDWAADYVAACYTNGIVAGVSATQYNGDSSVTTGQAALMLMKALGYFKYQGDFADDWLVETTKLGTQNGIFDGVDNGAVDPLTRNQVAQMILNTLEADAVEANGNSGVTIVDGNLVAGRATYSPRTNANDKKFGKIDNEKTYNYDRYIIQLGEELYGGDLEKNASETDDFGRPATQWKYKGNNVGKYGETPDYVLVVADDYTKKTDLRAILRDVADNNSLELTYQYENDNGRIVTAEAEYWLNGNNTKEDNDNEVDLESADLAKDVATYGTTYELYMVENKPDVVEKVVAYNYKLYQITDVDTDVSSGDSKKGVNAYISFDADISDAVNDTDIPGFNSETYVEDAYVAMIVNDKQEVVDSFIPETIEGSVGTKKGSENAKVESLTMDGDRYYTAGTMSDSSDFVYTTRQVETGSDNTYRLYLDHNNRILAVEGVEAVSSLGDVYFVDTIWKGSDTVAGVDTEPYFAQLVSLEDGTKAEYKLEKDNHKNGTETLDGQTADQLNKTFGKQLVTISDKKESTKGTDYSSKANNDQWNPKMWETKNDWTERTDEFSDLTLKKSTKSIAVDGETYRLNSSTVYLFLEKEKNDLSVSRYVGGVSYNTKDNVIVTAIKEKDADVASYVLFRVSDADQAAEYSEDVVFLYSESSDIGDGYRDQTVYLPDGSEETWQVVDGEFEGTGFYTYTTNDDGYYELELASEMKDTANLSWDDEEGVLSAWIFSNKSQLFENFLTVTKENGRVSDIDISNAVFKDVRDKDDRGANIEGTNYKEYRSALGSLDAVKRNMGSEKRDDIVSAELYLNVSKDGAVTIFLTSAPSLKADVPQD